MKKSGYLSWVAMAGIVASLAIAVPAFAQTSLTASKGWNGGTGGIRGGEAPGVVGTVSAVNGTTLTVTSRAMMMRARPNATSTAGTGVKAATVYTVNAASATVYKDGATSTISSITTGDTVMVQGTVSGTTVTATVIRDGVGQTGTEGGKGLGRGASSTMPAPMTSPIKGNGEPVVGGNVTAISGTTLTITNASNVTYTVDASSATIVKGNTTSTVSSIATGDTVVVQGAVNGNSVTASSVIDQGAKGQNASSTNGTPSAASHGNFVSGIFGAIGGFFSHIFGF